MASFTTSVKDEIASSETNRLESLALVCAFIKYSRNDEDNISINVENPKIARKLFDLLKRLYNVNIKLTIRTQKKFHVHTVYILEIKNKIDFILDDVENIFSNILTFSSEEKIGYLKGIFLESGSVNDPKTSKYHLEFLVSNNTLANKLLDLLLDFNFNAKILKREKGYMVYIKMSEEISDFIKLMGSINSLFYYEDIRIYRDHKNMVNRLNNCEQANVEKSMKTCMEQVNNINYLKEKDLMSLLDENTLLVIEYRLKYPETTLSELADIISLETDYKITKSGINHHFRKIKDIVNKSKNKA